MSARRARRMRSACVAFSTVIAIQRAGSARDGRHSRVVVPARVRQRLRSAPPLPPSSRLTRISARRRRLGVVLHEERRQRLVGLGQRALRESSRSSPGCVRRE